MENSKTTNNASEKSINSEDALFVYIIRTKNNELYIGQTDNLDRREFEHKFHTHGAKFFKDNGTDFNIVLVEKYQTRTDSMKREKQLKGWTRAKKEALIAKDTELLKNLSEPYHKNRI